MRMKKADKNCSGASGSLDLFSSFLGLQVPVNQNLLNRSRSPFKRNKMFYVFFWWLFSFTIFTVVHYLFVETVEMLGISRKGHPISCHGIPAPHSQQHALIILTNKIVQHRAIVDEGMKVSANNLHFNAASFDVDVRWMSIARLIEREWHQDILPKSISKSVLLYRICYTDMLCKE